MCADRRSPGNAVNVATHVLFQSRLLCTWPQTHQTHHYRSTNDSLLEFFRPFLCRVRLIRQDWSNWIKFYTFHPSNDYFSVERRLDGKKFASHCYGFHRDGGSEGARVRWWMSLHPARAVGVGHGQEKRGQPPARPGTVAEFLNRPLSGQKTPWSVVRDFPPSGVGERVCEGQRFSDGQRGREIPCANRDFYGRILFPFFLPLLLQLEKQPVVAAHLFEAKI